MHQNHQLAIGRLPIHSIASVGLGVQVNTSGLQTWYQTCEVELGDKHGIKLVFLIYALILRQTCVFKAGEKHKFKTSSLYISWQSFDPIRSFHQYNTENVCLSFYIIGLLDIGCTRFPYATFPWVVKRLHIALTFAPIIWTSIRCSFISDNNSNRRSHSFVEIFKPSQIST
ncbi:hypothetical protein BD560DRAFT_429138 [Blakeslea trispora]|nr:hypothetical protein BD560DRAFT_429138 [Blakeslea trispora]